MEERRLSDARLVLLGGFELLLQLYSVDSRGFCCSLLSLPFAVTHPNVVHVASLFEMFIAFVRCKKVLHTFVFV